MSTVILETERLRLRRMTRGDAAFMHEVMNEPDFIRNVADRGIKTLEDAERWIETKILPSYEREGLGFFAVEMKGNGVLVGTSGLIKRQSMDDVDIGYSILQRHSGNGYAFEAAAALMDYGRNVLGFPRIVGLTLASNSASIHLLEKLGLRFEKIVKLPEFERESMLFS